MTHKFDIEIAKEVGINAAIIYDNLCFWCLKNKANNRNKNDGNYWTYNSIRAWKELFPYIGESAIKTALKKLEDGEYILSGNYNKSSYDRTKWYSIIHLVEIANGIDENSQPIPSINTDSKPNIYDEFILAVKKRVKLKSKVTKTKEGAELFKQIEDKDRLLEDYVLHHEDKKDFAKRLTAYMEDYSINDTALDDLVNRHARA